MQTEFQPRPTPPSAGSPDQRSADRYGIALPITMEDAEGETHDISETGILFETSAEPNVGSQVGLTLQYTIDGQELHVRCQAEVVRVERVGERVNVAARLLSPLISGQ